MDIVTTIDLTMESGSSILIDMKDIALVKTTVSGGSLVRTKKNGDFKVQESQAELYEKALKQRQKNELRIFQKV